MNLVTELTAGCLSVATTRNLNKESLRNVLSLEELEEL